MDPKTATHRLCQALTDWLEAYAGSDVVRYWAARRELEIAWCIAVAVLRETKDTTSEST